MVCTLFYSKRSSTRNLVLALQFSSVLPYLRSILPYLLSLAVVGTFTTVLLWPCFFLLHINEIEIFELPRRPIDLASIAVNMIFGSLLPNYLWNVAFMFTTPLVVAIGISFTIPTTLVLEHFYGREPITSIYIISGTLAVCGFLLINLSTIYPQSDCSCRKLGGCCL